MNWTVYKIEEQPFIKVVTGGDFNLADHLKMIEDIISRDFWRPGTDVIFDNRNLEFGSTDLSVIKGLFSNHESNDERIGNGKAAMLMKSLADFGRARQLELISEGRVSAQLRVFLDEKEAVKWLTS